LAPLKISLTSKIQSVIIKIDGLEEDYKKRSLLPRQRPTDVSPSVGFFISDKFYHKNHSLSSPPFNNVNNVNILNAYYTPIITVKGIRQTIKCPIPIGIIGDRLFKRHPGHPQGINLRRFVLL